MLNKDLLIKKVKNHAGALINEKLPHHKQINILGGAIDNINKGLTGEKLSSLSQEDAKEFLPYRNYAISVRGVCSDLIEKINSLDDDKLEEFNILDDVYWEKVIELKNDKNNG